MVVFVVFHVIFFALDFTTSEEFLGVFEGIKDDPHASCIVDRLEVLVKERILSVAISLVTINVVKFKLDIRFFRVEA
jgi:hypothetical protein